MFQNQNRFRALSIELIALVVLIPLAIFLTIKIWHQSEINPTQQIATTTIDKTLTPTVSISPSPSAKPTLDKKTKLSVAPSTQPTSAVINITCIAPNKNFSYKISATKQTTVIAVMLEAQQQGLILKTKDFGAPLGMLIEEINNISNDSKNQKYWTLYVNNIRSAVGASTATVSPGDTITWKFENTTL